MKKACLALGFVVSIVAWLGLSTLALEPNSKVAIKTSVPERTLHRYNVIMNISSAAGGANSKGVDTSLSMTVQHKYLDRTSDGMLPVEISLDSGMLCSGDQKLAVAPGIYPKLTVLLDRDYNIQNVLGTGSLQQQGSAPGINYGNLIVLFYLPGGGKERSIGDSWVGRISIPDSGQIFDIASTLKGIEMLDGVNAAVVEQVINRVDSASAKIAVNSRFAIDNGSLLKSHVSYTIPASSDKNSFASDIAVAMDIQLVK
ncbi:MAG: hypothetical protein ABFD49_03925 [Armatimonadota bacterium]|nr:hypothetical protein [bacterium]